MVSPSRTDPVRIAAFTMEVGLESALPTYSGGLGVLAGDTARAAADLGLPFVMVSLLHRRGYFRQSLDAEGNQVEEEVEWKPEQFLQPLDPRVRIMVEGEPVSVRSWVYWIPGPDGGEVPVYLLDTDLPENSAEDRRITDYLYGGDRRLRLRQELVLGVAGVRMLRALKHDGIQTFHMNEGHSALLVLELLREFGSGVGPDLHPAALQQATEAVRARCVFTTHTPVPAGHDRFDLPLVEQVVGPERTGLLQASGVVEGGEVNLTAVALRFSRFTNGVALRHARLSREMFPGRDIQPITNGVHAATWTGDAFRALFDRHLSGWRQDPYLLRHAVGIPLQEILTTHAESKEALHEVIRTRTGVDFRPERLTMAFARRAAPYKRADLLTSDLGRLRELARRTGGLQIVYAGKAHPNDQAGKEMIRRVVLAGRELGDELPLVYLEDYDMELGRLLASGSDLWLNMPRKPLEASGTSGMKAALNGVPCLSILDGWWIEGHVEGVTGWAIDAGWERPADDAEELDLLLHKLEETVLPLYYGDPLGWAKVMRSAIQLNGSHFHTRRMLQEYVDRAYETK